MQASQHLVTLNPEAVELVDRTMIDLGRSIPIYRATIDQMVKNPAGGSGEPDSLLIVEFHGYEDAPLLEALARLEEMMADLGLPGAVVQAVDGGFQARIAEVRGATIDFVTGGRDQFAFNDDPPAEVSSSYYAHAKSVVAFNEAGGYDDNSCFERDDCWIVLEAATVSE